MDDVHRTERSMQRTSTQALIRDLADRTGRSFEEARRTYEAELASLESEAKVQAYVPVIAGKRAREALMRPH
jgi:hypothetical protein